MSGPSNTKQSLIHSLNLSPHPEGGYFSETYRSQETCTPPRGVRSISTAIYFLLGKQDRSRFHVIQSDEIWHHYDGAPLEIHEITQEGHYKVTYLGKDFQHGQVPQYCVPKGHIFGSKVSLPSLSPKDKLYSLVGCTVAPGFDFNDFHLFSTSELVNMYPNLSEKIQGFFKD